MADLAGTPQPPPKVAGTPVSEALIEWINSQSGIEEKDKLKAVEIIKARCKYGLDKYGQVLMSGDGRCTVADAVQEAGDLLQYAYKAKINGELTAVRDEVAPILVLLIKLLL